jgi:glutathione S-transferase
MKIVCHYLAVQHDTSLTVRPNETEYARFLNWMYHADATLTFPQAIMLRYTQLQPGRADNAVDDYVQFHIGRLRLLDEVLASGRKYLVENRFTVADICVTYPLYLGQSIIIGGKPLSTLYKPQTLEYLEAMTSRPGFLHALERQRISFDAFNAERVAELC